MGQRHLFSEGLLAIPFGNLSGKTVQTVSKHADIARHLTWMDMTGPDGMDRPGATTDQKVAIASAGQSMVLSLLCRGHAIAS
jgi:hypothetical protein